MNTYQVYLLSRSLIYLECRGGEANLRGLLVTKQA